MNLFFLSGGSFFDDPYSLIIAASSIIILSFFFNQISKKTNIPSVLLLIILGIFLKIGMDALGLYNNFDSTLEILGIVGLIMIVLEAALELKLEKEKMVPILLALGIAIVGLIASAFVAKLILQYFITDLPDLQAWIYATPLSILSSAIIIPSVSDLRIDKKEFHIYESTFSDIIGIMMFYYFINSVDAVSAASGWFVFFRDLVLTLLIALVSSYLIILIFQKIKSHVKLFLLIAVLLLLYAVAKKFHLSALLIVLIFGLVIANMKLFFPGKMKKYLNYKKAIHIYEELHIITLETAFVVRTFFFVIFGITILLSSLLDLQVALISLLIIASIYIIRLALLRLAFGKDILPQIFIAPRGLITILLFTQIPDSLAFESFNSGILLFVIIGTSLIMTGAMIFDKSRSEKSVKKAESVPVGYLKWKPKSLEE